MLSTFLKSKIKLYQIVCMVGLLFIHNYNYAPSNLTPCTTLNAPFSIGNFLELLFSNSIFRFRIALLMAISGYLMANSKVISYQDLIIKKIRTLLLPYVFISALGLVITFIFDIVVFGNPNILHTGMLGKSLIDFSAKDFIHYLFVAPVTFQLWYLKTIFLLAVLSPAIRYILSKIPVQVLVIMFVIWMFTNILDGATRDRAFVFYFFGFYLKMYNKDLTKPIPFFRPQLALFLFIGISLLRTWLAFYHDFPFLNVKYILIMLFKANEIFGVYAIWFCFDGVVAYILKQGWYSKVCNCSFFVYAFHAPLINYIGSYLMMKNVFTLHYSHLLTYILLPISLLPLLIIIDKIIFSFSPILYFILSGGRGEAVTMPISNKKWIPSFNFNKSIYLPELSKSFLNIKVTMINNFSIVMHSALNYITGYYLYCVKVRKVNFNSFINPNESNALRYLSSG